MRKEQILQQVRGLKQRIIPDGKLFLFGSQARGDANNESDWDFLLLLDKDKTSPEDFDTFAYPFVEFGWKLGEYFSIKLYTFKEWQQRCITPFYKNVQREGIEL